MSVSLIHPRYARMVSRNMAALFPLTADVEVKTVTQDESGQEVETWAAVDGMKHIPAALAPVSAIEQQAAGYTVTDRAWHVLMAGGYPDITTRHRVTIDDEIYDIDAVEIESHGSLTRLQVQRIGV